MLYRNFLISIICIFLSNCTATTSLKDKPNMTIVNGYSNKGFALIYSEDLFKKKNRK